MNNNNDKSKCKWCQHENHQWPSAWGVNIFGLFYPGIIPLFRLELKESNLSPIPRSHLKLFLPSINTITINYYQKSRG